VENYGREVESKVLGKLMKVKHTTLADFDRDQEKGHTFLNMCSIYFMICKPHFVNNHVKTRFAKGSALALKPRAG
jgi:hypothetical protein